MAATAHDGTTHQPGRDGASMGALLGGIVTDLEALVQQELALASHQIREEVDGAASAVLGLALGGLTIALGAALLGAGAALGVARSLRWPSWMGLAAIGAGVTLFGAILLVVLWRRVPTLETPLWRRRRSSSDRT